MSNLFVHFMHSNPFRKLVAVSALFLLLCCLSSWALAQTGLLNDTGQIACYNTSNTSTATVACASTYEANQDAHYGRDVAGTNTSLSNMTKTGGGAAGFDFSCVKWDGTVVNGANCTTGLTANTSGTATGTPSTDWACVKDNVTGLVWSLQSQGSMNWTAAQNAHNSHNTTNRCGYTNWRVPTRRELLSIVDNGLATVPSIDLTYFPTASSIASAAYWSSQFSRSDSTKGWGVSFARGTVFAEPKTYLGYVRLVRSDGPPLSPSFTVNANGTVTDNTTQLVWDRCILGRIDTNCTTPDRTAYLATIDVNGYPVFTWESALRQVSSHNSNNHLGFNDWRVPNKNELESLVNIDLSGSALDSTAFPDNHSVGRTYTSTSDASNQYPRAWVVYPINGDTILAYKTNISYVRLVRGGPNFATYRLPRPVNGTCGSAHRTIPLVTNAPISSLCSAGTSSTVASNNSDFTWTCNGVDGGTNANCSASRGYTVTPSVGFTSTGTNGNISPNTPQIVAYNAQPTFTVSPNAGYGTGVAAGTCGGNLVGNTYTTNPITGACTVIATFVGNDSTPDAFSFTAANNVAQSTLQTSNTITVSGLTTAANIGITGGEYKINSGSFVGTAGTVNNGDTVTVRHTSSASYSTAVTTTLTIGGVSGNFVSTTVPAPVNGTCGSAHSTTPVLSAPSANLCTTGTASGITSNAANFTWTCAGASGGTTANCSATRGYAVTANAGAGGSINPSGTQAVALNGTASFTVTPNAGYVINSVTGCGGGLVGNTYSTTAVTTDCTVSASFTANDSTPDAFVFDTLRDVPINTQQTSNAITVSGINTAVSIAVQNGEYQINNGAWVTTAGTLNQGDTVKVRHISGGTHGMAVVTSVQIGGVHTTFITVTPHLANTGGGGTDLNTPPAPSPSSPPTIERGSDIDGTGGIYQVAPSAADPNAPGRLRVQGTVTLQPQGNQTSPNLQITSTGERPAQFGFVLDSQGRIMPRLLSGSATLQSNTTDDLQPLLAWLRANTVVAVAGLSCGPASPSAVLVGIDPSTQHTQLSVLSCSIVLSDTTSPSPSNPIARNTTTPPTAPSYFSGETLTLNPEGDITAVHLGSADQRGITGDPISTAHTPSNLSHRSSTPRLSGSVARVQRDLPTLLADTLHQSGYPSPIVSGDTGQVSAQVNGQRHQWQAVGQIRIDTTSPATSSVQPNPQGGLSINALGINIELVPSALHLTSLAHALHTLGGTLQVQPHGAYLITLGAQTIATHIGPALTPTPFNPTTGFATTTAPAPALIDFAGTFFTQTLYPGVADFTAVQQLLAQTDPGHTAAIQANGTLQLTLHGQPLTLWPEFILSPIPPNRNGQTHWLDGNTLFIALPHIPGFVQSFVVR